MIDVINEQLIALQDVAALLSEKTGKKHSKRKITRWANDGQYGEILVTIAIGKTRYTSHEELNRFLHNCEIARRESVAHLTKGKTKRRRSKYEIRSLDDRLKRLGVDRKRKSG